jgi:hypothetical protein
MEFGVGALAYALFYPGGASGPPGILARSIKDAPKDLLYPAIRSVALNPDSHARGCLRSTYGLLTLKDVQAVAPEFFHSVDVTAPANTMFSKGARLAGIQAMARLHIEEGIGLSMKLMQLKEWGRNYVVTASLNTLQKYGGAAKSVVPRLKELAEQWKKEKQHHKKILETIAVIEKDRNPPKLVSLKAYLKTQRR